MDLTARSDATQPPPRSNAQLSLTFEDVVDDDISDYAAQHYLNMYLKFFLEHPQLDPYGVILSDEYKSFLEEAWSPNFSL